MKDRGHIVLFILCLAGTIGFYHLGLVWSFADFHPGSDVQVPPEITRKAERGSKMIALFLFPVVKFSAAVSPGGWLLPLTPLLLWIVIFSYAVTLHCLVAVVIRGLKYLRRPGTQETERLF